MFRNEARIVINRFWHSLILGLMVVSGLAMPGRAEETVGPSAESLASARAKATEFLIASQQSDGSWTSEKQPGITGLVTFALLEGGVKPDHPAVTKALKHLTAYVQPDGGIYHPETGHKNYETSITLLAFRAANTNGQYDALLKKAVEFLRGIQWDEAEGADPSQPAYGGQGYGRSKRPDLSNTAFFLEALKSSGVAPEDEAMQRALVFISRCQNLESENNTTEFASKVNDGGFYYTPAGGGNSQAGNTAEGGLRSYASMTYAGLKSMIYAGLKEDDPRVKAATSWIRKNYTVTENPGLGQQGVYYYHQTFAKALSAMKVDQFEAADGTKHDWRKELAEHLFQTQAANGSWLNKNDRWMEGDPNLATSYALMALKYCEPKTAVK
ncbi:MAG: hypothetical protein DWH81_07005 [Planctomycetota bacterium]|nr:MAG: hypothetical protein DWH81_07005 [Planctomycetota bacterium]